MGISTKKLNELPAPRRLLAIGRALAVIELIINADDAERRVRWHPSWAPGEEAVQLDDREGNALWIWACAAGVVIRGYAHESKLIGRDPEQVFEGLPDALVSARTEPAFGDDATFVIWREASDDRWRCVPPKRGKDGSAELLQVFEDHPLNAIEFSEPELERRLPMKAVETFYQGRTLSPETIALLDPEADIDRALNEAEALGWPVTREARPTPAPKPSKGVKRPKAGAHDAGFFIARDGEVVSLIVGDRVDVQKRNPDLYLELIEYVRRAIADAPERDA